MRDVIGGRYEVVDYIGSAAFSRVVQCVDGKTGQMVSELLAHATLLVELCT